MYKNGEISGGIVIKEQLTTIRNNNIQRRSTSQPLIQLINISLTCHINSLKSFLTLSMIIF